MKKTKQYLKGYSDGYMDGFQIGRESEIKTINEAQKLYEKVDMEKATDNFFEAIGVICKEYADSKSKKP